MPRYQVSGLPPQAGRGLSAFFPHFNRLAASGAQQYKDGVIGSPGTGGIPVTPQAIRLAAGDVTAVAAMGTASSAYAPWTIYPDLYYARPERNYRPGLLIQMYDPVRPQDTTMIPVPAVSLRQLYLRESAALAAGITPSGPRQVKWLPKLIRWAGGRQGNGEPVG